MDSSAVKENSFELQEVTRNQVIIEDSEIGNQDAVRRAIKKYQNKINQMVRIIQRQKKQNDSLKAQLKTLNESLNSVINKLSHKSLKESSVAEVPKDDVMKKQLENQMKKNIILHKEVQQLRLKLKTYDVPRVNELQNQIKQKTTKINQLTQQVKVYEKIEKQQKNTDIYKREEENKHQFALLNQEIQHLKNKLAQSKKQEQNLQKKLKRQHEQIINLDSKSGKMSSSADKSQPLKERYEHLDASRKTEDKKSHEKIAELRERCENLQITKKATEKHLKHEIQILKNKNSSLQKQLEQYRSNLKRKQKQAHILIAKMRQTQRKNYNTLEPVQKLKVSEQFGTTGLFDQRKQFKGLVHVQGNYRKFDDTQGLSLEKNYRIKSFVFTWFEQHILSLDTVYELKDGSERQISSFKINHQYNNIKHGGLELGEFEYIKDIQIYCGKSIEFIRIQSSRDRIAEIGNEKNHTKCKKFTFDIRTNEKPIAFLGAIDNKRVLGVQNSREMLISLGLQIKKKDVLGKSRFNPGRTNSLNKYSSKSALDKARNNDKNIIDEED